MLTKETRLLINHWNAVEDIIAGERLLREQLTAFLNSLQHDLERIDWWTDMWHFMRVDAAQVHIAHDKWRVKRDYALWVGVEGFTPPVLFGNETLQSLYLFSPLEKPTFIAAVRGLYQSRELQARGEIQKGRDTYIIREFLPKYLPGKAPLFEKTTRSSILKFLSFYAKQEHVLSAQVARHFKS
jgi:hypothetical protein